jgi:hypothetical protein
VRIAALAALGLVAAFGCGDAPTAPAPAGETSEARELSLEGVALSDADSALSAARVIARKRTGGGGFFVYHDLWELDFSATELAIRADGASLSIAPLIDYATAIASLFGNVPASVSGDRSGVLSRALFTDLAIRVEYAGAGSLRLSAKKARLNLDSNSLVLEEEVVVDPPVGKSLAAPIAVLAHRHDGVYLPRGYWLGTPTETKCRVSAVYSPRLGALEELRRVCGGTPTYKSTFFVLEPGGALSAAPAIPSIQYEDYVDTREEIVLSHLLEHTPPEWKPLLIGVLSSQLPLTLKGPEPSPAVESSAR